MARHPFERISCVKCILLKNSVCALAFFCPADGLVLPVCYLSLNTFSAACFEASEWDKDTRFYRIAVVFRSGCGESQESWNHSRPSVNFKTFSS